MTITRFVGVWVLATLAAASCSKRERATKPADTTSKASQGMADMPGMGGTSEVPKRGGVLAGTVALSAAQIQHGGVKWGTVAMSTAGGTAVVPGEVFPNEDRTARLGAPARGRILSVAVRPGDRVAAGQVLVTMQSPEAGMAQSDLAKAEAELSARRAEAQYASSARARAERLLTLKAIPRQDYERAVTDEEHARASVVQAEAEARRARATAQQLSVGANESGEVALRSPFAGVILSRSAIPGAVVDAGAPLVVVTDPSRLWLIVNAPEQLAGLFHRGGRLRFTVPAYPADTFAARVDAVGVGLEPETRTLSVRAVVDDSRNRLKPQMLANVVVEGVGSSPAAWIPEDAVQLLQGKPHVFLARPDSKGGATFERREVLLGSRAGGRVAVLRGLGAGDTVVLAGAFAVKAEFQKSSMPKMEM